MYDLVPHPSKYREGPEANLQAALPFPLLIRRITIFFEDLANPPAVGRSMLLFFSTESDT